MINTDQSQRGLCAQSIHSCGPYGSPYTTSVLKKGKTLDISEVSHSASVTSHNLNIQHINNSLASSFVKVNKNEMVWIKIKLSNPFTILQIAYYYIFYGDDILSGVTACVKSEKHYDCIKLDNGTAIDINRNDKLVAPCGQLSLKDSVEQEDQVYIMNRGGVVGDEVYLSRYSSSDKKPKRIAIADIAVIGFGKNIIML